MYWRACPVTFSMPRTPWTTTHFGFGLQTCKPYYSHLYIFLNLIRYFLSCRFFEVGKMSWERTKSVRPLGPECHVPGALAINEAAKRPEIWTYCKDLSYRFCTRHPITAVQGTCLIVGFPALHVDCSISSMHLRSSVASLKLGSLTDST